MRNGLSYSECGKLGAEKSKLVSETQKQERIDQYLNDPRKCKTCLAALSYEKRHNTFCNHSCAAKTSNQGQSKNPYGRNKNNPNIEMRTNPKTLGICLNCGLSCKCKYCSIKCQQEYNRKKTFSNIEENGFPVNKAGLVPESLVRRYIRTIRPHVCEICKNTEWQGSKIPLVVDHIDGNSSNNALDNLRLLCNNCDAQTPTYKNKNRGNGRSRRMQRYHDGKSF